MIKIWLKKHLLLWEMNPEVFQKAICHISQQDYLYQSIRIRPGVLNHLMFLQQQLLYARNSGEDKINAFIQNEKKLKPSLNTFYQ